MRFAAVPIGRHFQRTTPAIDPFMTSRATTARLESLNRDCDAVQQQWVFLEQPQLLDWAHVRSGLFRCSRSEI